MRPLTEEEAKSLFEKLAKYIGENVKLLLERSDGNYVFRYHKDKVREVFVNYNHEISSGGFFLDFQLPYSLKSRELLHLILSTSFFLGLLRE